MKKQIKRLTSLILVITIMATFITKGVINVRAATLTEEQFAAKITSLRQEYPHGKYWNKYNGVDSEGVAKAGSIMCNGYSPSNGKSCKDNGYCAFGGYCTCECGEYNGAWQCNGFARRMGAKVFGVAPSNSAWTKIYDSSTVYAGDIVRFGDNENIGHSIFITKVVGNTLYYCDCNATGPCQIRWDGSISNIGSGKHFGYNFLYVYHYSGNTLTGSGHTHTYTSTVTKQPTCTEDGVRTYTCTCGASYTETISKLGHDYVPVVTDPTCTAGGYTTYTCSRCHDTYISDETDSIDHSCILSKISINGNNTADIDYYCTECEGNFKKTLNITDGKSEYISEKIIGLYDETTQEKTQYRSAEKETKTSTTKELEGWKYDGKYSEYGAWSEWKTGTASKNELTDVETCTMYMWYAYICPNCGTHDPYTGACSNCGTTLNANHFWSKWYNFPFSNGEASVEGKTKTTELGNGKLYSANDHAPEAGYRTRNREYLLYKVSSFSDWQDEEIIADDNTIIETRTVYSYDLSGSGAHSYKKEWSSDENQHWHECSECSAKTDVENHIYDNDNDTTCNVCGYVRSIENPEAPVDENAPQIVFESKRTRKATEFTVTAEIKNNPGFSAASIKIIYDTSRLQLESALLSEAFSNGASVSYDNLPKITFVKGGNVTTDGVFLTLTFKVLDTAEPGDSLISLEYDEGDISNYSEEDVNFAVVQGTIAVVDYIPGDINDDDKVNTKDLTRLLKYLNDEPVEVNEYALDVNGDGKVNTKDLTRLLKYLNDEPVEIF